MKTPYLSIVIPSRNDDYAGGTLRRLQLVVNSLFEQLERYKLVSELIIVDWNPPPERPLLKNAILWPSGANFCTARVIEVPPPIHYQFRFANKLPFLVHRARNVGIRRARGRFILPIATDILFSEELIRFLASKQLKEDLMYRVDRYDVPAAVIEVPSLIAQLAYCDRNVLRVHGRKGLGTTDEFGEGVPLHTNGSGDFTLLSREFWFRVHGIPEESEWHSLHFDSVLCYMAYSAGAKEEVLRKPMCIYHMEHESVWRPNLSWLDKLLVSRAVCSMRPYVPKQLGRKAMSVARRITPSRSKIDLLRIPVIELGTTYATLCKDMVDGKRPYTYNNDAWGLACFDLNETVVLRGFWDN